jgi:endonuclease YncB( thermonuclease family)
MGEWVGLAVFALALGAIWMSTRQFPTRARLAIWLAGVAALGATGWFVLREANIDDVTSIASALRFEIIEAALSANLRTVDDAILPLLLFFVIIGVALAGLALAALTRGEAIERVTRPMILTLFGVVAGGVIALSAVAVGLAGYFKPRAYIAAGSSVVIVDGDTLRLGDVSLRLDDIDALERDQSCVSPRGETNCGSDARAALRRLVRNAVIVCTRRDGNTTIPPREALGRPLVTCQARSDGASVDLGDEMLEGGWAVPYVRPRHAESPILVGEGCTLHPSHWRGREDLRAALQNGGGACAGGANAAR